MIPRIRVLESAEDVARVAAGEIAEMLRNRRSGSAGCVLGLATGASAAPVYRGLIAIHRRDPLDLGEAVTFNLDEFHPIDPADPNSFRNWMNRTLFDHVPIPPEARHFPLARGSRAEVEKGCVAYEEAIRDHGGIDLQILGIGRSGHIGFNEPGSTRESRTRILRLHPFTREDAAARFGGIDRVPLEAVTMGVRTILDARRTFVLACGPAKAPLVRAAIEGPITPGFPASFLQLHPDCTWLIDPPAAASLSLRHG